MKIFGNEKTKLSLSDKAFEMYSRCDPCEITEHDDGSYSIRGIEDRDGMTASEVSEFFEELADELREPLD